MEKSDVEWSRAVMYKTVSSDISDINIQDYNMLVFFSPNGIKSIQENFSDFKQNDIKIAVFGNTTQNAALEAGFRIDIMAPSKESPSMTMAIEKYIRSLNK